MKKSIEVQYHFVARNFRSEFESELNSHIDFRSNYQMQAYLLSIVRMLKNANLN